MFIKEISISRTVGFIMADGKTRFKKLTIGSSADLNENDDPDKSYQKFSDFIERQFEYEKTLTNK